MEIRELHAYIDPESQRVKCTSETRRPNRRLPVVGVAIVLLVCLLCAIFAVCAVLAIPWRR